ncbi:uncharacterized protein PFL1_02845 [Pseudozyma flocculosa PF-1]|uniref:tRNA-dihydrouridine(16/17) synthase [NAD(P)(+)] n=2 Tax=Pseudozyma flocculosa TaxID=84751 RepID=A0A5C3F286_9BASI|nr:uncharacterized protein PFL1_02845 [Pseudozyma flocculosa PF-1]EPQ29626.1 hypothetical protein PFL1_02845 [Pseudozyma flocculosa PF-1]SPO38190.1 related to tRNA dihydrouridine synthase [Pseudozyma flocculosa]
MPEAVAVPSATQPGKQATNGTSAGGLPVVDTIPDLDSFPPTGTPIHDKLASWDFYRSMGSPRRVVAPMVDQSELPWRILSRRYGSDLVYTPMINARLFVDEASKKSRSKYQEVNFNRSCGEEGAEVIDLANGSEQDRGEGSSTDTDRPLLVQFCANDPQTLLKAAEVVQDRCNGVDLNLGCPQHIARRGHYGSFLMEDWPLIFSLINILHINLKVPVTAKMRVYDSVEKTIAYARMLERAGAQIITVHGRTREMKGHKTGLADWQKIRAVKQAVKVPVFANGNILYPRDWHDAIETTTADGVMSAEGNLYNPAIFADPMPAEATPMFPMAPALPFPSITAMANEYLDIVAALRTPTAGSAIKAHFFRLCRPALEVHRDLREMLGKSRFDPSKAGEARIESYRAFIAELERRLKVDRESGKYDQPLETPLPGSVSFLAPPPVSADGKEVEDAHRPRYIPHWLAQPYFRPPLPVQEGEAGDESRKARKERVKETKGLTEIRDIQTEGEEKLEKQEMDLAKAEKEQGQGQDQGRDQAATASRPRSENGDAAAAATTADGAARPEKKARVD